MYKKFDILIENFSTNHQNQVLKSASSQFSVSAVTLYFLVSSFEKPEWKIFLLQILIENGHGGFSGRCEMGFIVLEVKFAKRILLFKSLKGNKSLPFLRFIWGRSMLTWAVKTEV